MTMWKCGKGRNYDGSNTSVIYKAGRAHGGRCRWGWVKDIVKKERWQNDQLERWKRGESVESSLVEQEKDGVNGDEVGTLRASLITVAFSIILFLIPSRHEWEPVSKSRSLLRLCERRSVSIRLSGWARGLLYFNLHTQNCITAPKCMNDHTEPRSSH